MRNEILDRDHHECQKCGTPYGLEIHHIVERSRGGRGVFENGVTLCWKCHHNVQGHQNLLDEWYEKAHSQYGDNFWCDEYDREAYLNGL